MKKNKKVLDRVEKSPFGFAIKFLLLTVLTILGGILLHMINVMMVMSS